MTAPAVKASDLCRRFGRHWALARLDLHVEVGERFLVCGENGGGKTTLLRLLATALAPTRGDLGIFGLHPARDRLAIRRRIALVSHLPAVYEDLTARENLEVQARLAGVAPRAGEWLRAVALADLPVPVRAFSAGMRKRLSFARLLAQSPRLALLDEPYGQLDPEGMDVVDGLVDDLSSQGCTVVMASHHVERAAARCHRALLLHGGLPRWTGEASLAQRAWRTLHRRPEAS